MSLHPIVPSTPCIAFYKGQQKGLTKLYSGLTKLLDRGPYDHCEFVFSNGSSASASFLDKGVRFKDIGYSTLGSWDFLPLPAHLELAAYAWAQKHKGAPYDLWGNLRFATNFAQDTAENWFCSEAIMAMLGVPEPYRYGPSGCATALQFHFNTKIIEVSA